MKLLSRLTLCALPVLALVPSQAALNSTLVPADAKWVVHADLNALRTSILGKELISMAEKAQMGATEGLIGLDIPKVLSTVGSVTAYGTSFNNEPSEMDGTLVVQGTADLRKIAEGLLVQQNVVNPNVVVEITDLPFPAYGIKSGGPRAPKAAAKDASGKDEAPKPAATPATAPGKIEVIIAFPPESLVLVSRSKAQLLKAHELFKGKGATLAKAAASPLQRFITGAPADSYLFAASVKPPAKVFEGDTPQARIMSMANAGSLSIGEHGLEAFAKLDLASSSDAMAEKLMKILQGMTAMLSMAESSDRQLGEFLNATNVSRNDDLVTLTLTYPGARLVQMIRTYQKPVASLASGGNRPATPAVNYGRVAGEWQSQPTPSAKDAAIDASHQIENVELKNGAVITLGRDMNGARSVKLASVEVVQGNGSPLTFKTEFMRSVGRNGAVQFQFPGADGAYTLKVNYALNDPEGKAKFTVWVRDPRPAPAPAAKPAGTP